MNEMEDYKKDLYSVIDRNINKYNEYFGKTMSFLKFLETLNFEYKYEIDVAISVDIGITMFSFFPSAICQMKEIFKCILIDNKVTSYAMQRILVENYILLVFLFQNKDCCESYFNWSLYLGNKNYKKYEETTDIKYKDKVAEIINKESKKINILNNINPEKVKSLFKNDYGWAYLKFQDNKKISLSSISEKCSKEKYVYEGKEYNKFSEYSEYIHSNNMITKELNKSFSNIDKMELLYEINKNIYRYTYIYANTCKSTYEQNEKFVEVFEEISLLLGEIEKELNNLLKCTEVIQ